MQSTRDAQGTEVTRTSLGEPGAEKRRKPRVRARLPIAIDLRGRSYAGLTVNLSLGGILLFCVERLSVGTAISGTLTLGDRAVRFSALVRWSRMSARGALQEPQHLVGIEFLDTPGGGYAEYVQNAVAIPDEAEPAPAPAPRAPAPARTVSRDLSAAASPQREAPEPTMVDQRLPPRLPVAAPQKPSQLPSVRGPVREVTGRISVPRTRSYADLAPTQAISPLETRHEGPTAETQIVPRFGLMPGLNGKAEGSTRSSSQRLAGTSPLAASAAAQLFERAAIQAVVAALPPGHQTVGAALQVSLSLPPQVTLGAKLEASATLVEISADRMLRFRLELREGSRVVATGEHQRLVVIVTE